MYYSKYKYDRYYFDQMDRTQQLNGIALQSLVSFNWLN